MRRHAVIGGLRALWPALMVVAGAGAVGILSQRLPAPLLSILAGATLVIAAWLLYRGTKTFHPINEQEAGYRLEQQAGLSELAPLTSSADRAVSGDAALWSWHRRRLETLASALSKPANPTITRQDYARLAALCVAIGICVWQPKAAGRALNFDLSPLVGDGNLVLDAWAQPPEYTGLPVVRLNRETGRYALPAGSTIFARMDGAIGAPRLRVSGQTVKMTRVRGQAWTASVKLSRSGTVTLDRLGTRASWHIDAVPDQAPVLLADEPIRIDERGRLDVAFTGSDDYGIDRAFLRITPLETPIGLVGNDVFETPIPLEGEAGEDGARRVFIDVSQHALTGLGVRVQIVVADGLGQETASLATPLLMPQVEWKSTLGAALQEQRLMILREARPYKRQMPVTATLFDPETNLPIKLDLSEPLAGAPDGIAKAERLLRATLVSMRDVGLSETGAMAFQYASERLALARNRDDAVAVAPLLWALAMQAEAADQSPAQQKIAAARQALEQALKNGAPDSTVQQLTQELREAVGERLDEMAQQSEGQGQSDGSGQGGGISSSDIDKMLRELEQSGGAGARLEALEQLDKLGELMENLEAGQSGNGEGQQSGEGAGGSGPMDDAMRAQRDLSDETRDRANQNPGVPASDLADRQNDLADRLDPGAQTGQQPKTSPQEPEGQAEAGKSQAAAAMREAAQALRRGDLAGAAAAQSRAERALQEAAQASSEQAGGEQDPLGRNMPRLDDGRGTKVPDQGEKRRARDVREELRRRQADPSRDGQERDYLDRLLKNR